MSGAVGRNFGNSRGHFIFLRLLGINSHYIVLLTARHSFLTFFTVAIGDRLLTPFQHILFTPFRRYLVRKECLSQVRSPYLFMATLALGMLNPWRYC